MPDQVEQLFPEGNPAIQSPLFHMEPAPAPPTRTCPACGRQGVLGGLCDTCKEAGTTAPTLL